MVSNKIYHEGSRQLQDLFGTRKLADRLEQVEARSALTVEDQIFISQSCMFFLATADEQGRPTCSYKGGLPGFVKVLDEQTLAYPDYDGNGTFRSLGNILINPNISMLFLDFENGERTLVEGVASISEDDPLLSEWPDAQLVIRLSVEHAFSSCSRYIHKMKLVEHSIDIPKEEYTQPVPDWKKKETYQDVLPSCSTKNEN
jgi:uncharacterized protein